MTTGSRLVDEWQAKWRDAERSREDMEIVLHVVGVAPHVLGESLRKIAELRSRTDAGGWKPEYYPLIRGHLDEFLRERRRRKQTTV